MRLLMSYSSINDINQHTGHRRDTLLPEVGLATERGNTLESRRKFYMGCREPPSLPKKSARPVA